MVAYVTDMIPVRSTLILACNLLTLSCTSAAEDSPAPVVRDSAGVQIVENPSPLSPAHPVRTVPPDPLVTIGSVDGPPEAQLYRVHSVRRAPDGTFVVANAGTHEVRLFGPDGRHLRSFGQEGEGPGEFKQLRGVWPMAVDSILTFDLGRRRVQVFSREGELGRSHSLSGGLNEMVAGILGDGSLVTYRTVASRPGMQRHIQSRVFYRRSASGEFVDSLTAVEWIEIIPTEVQEGLFMLATPLFWSGGAFAVGEDRIYVSDAKRPEVRVVDATGRLVRIIRWADHDRTVTASDRQAYRERRLAASQSDEERRRLRRLLDDAEWASEFPSLSEIHVDSDGRVWVRAYAPPPAEEERSWWVFDRDGAFQEEVRTPAGFEVHEIGDDGLIGTFRNEFDVEQVRLYPREIR